MWAGQSDVSISILSVGSGSPVHAQKFRAAIGGTIESISIIGNRYQIIPTPPLVVEVRQSENDVPGKLLGTAMVAAPDISVPQIPTVDFSAAGIELIAGNEYFAVFHTEYLTPPLYGGLDE